MLNDDLDLIKKVGCQSFVDCLANQKDICQKNPQLQGCRIIYLRYCNFQSGGNAFEANNNLRILLERRKAA